MADYRRDRLTVPGDHGLSASWDTGTHTSNTRQWKYDWNIMTHNGCYIPPECCLLLVPIMYRNKTDFKMSTNAHKQTNKHTLSLSLSPWGWWCRRTRQVMSYTHNPPLHYLLPVHQLAACSMKSVSNKKRSWSPSSPFPKVWYKHCPSPHDLVTIPDSSLASLYSTHTTKTESLIEIHTTIILTILSITYCVNN